MDTARPSRSIWRRSSSCVPSTKCGPAFAVTWSEVPPLVGLNFTRKANVPGYSWVRRSCAASGHGYAGLAFGASSAMSDKTDHLGGPSRSLERRVPSDDVGLAGPSIWYGLHAARAL